MPWTPMAVSAWRTSSSLKGLMIATTSFMIVLRSNIRKHLRVSALWRIWHFFGRIGKKTGGLAENGCRKAATLCNILWLWVWLGASGFQCRWPNFVGARVHGLSRGSPGLRFWWRRNVGAIVVRRVWGTAGRSLFRGAIPRPDRQADDHAGHAGLERGHVRLAKSGRYSRPAARWITSAGFSAFGRGADQRWRFRLNRRTAYGRVRCLEPARALVAL